MYAILDKAGFELENSVNGDELKYKFNPEYHILISEDGETNLTQLMGLTVDNIQSFFDFADIDVLTMTAIHYDLSLEKALDKIKFCYMGKYNNDLHFTFVNIKQSLESLPSYIKLDWDETTINFMLDYEEVGMGYYFRKY